MTAHRSIVVATDGSEKAAVATTAAAKLAAAWGAQLHVVHAWSPIPRMVATYGTGAGATAVMSPPILEELRIAAIEVLGAAGTEGRRAGCAVEEHLLDSADVPDAVLALAEEVDAELIVAGRRGLGALGRLFLGSVSEPLLHRSTRPLLLVHGDAACWPPQTVVAAVDGSGDADRAAVLGAAVAAATGAGVELLHAVARDAEGLVDVDGDTYRRTIAEETARLWRQAERLTARTGAGSVRARLELAAPVTAIKSAVDSVPGPVLVAMGTHGRGRAHRLVLGSVALSVVHEGVASVLVVPPRRRVTG
ncbi:MAG TPA: universal stress protein [Candidatus Angelobacter sp.]|jgi:nucleotide-binding universal stress UspA family protein|nr:universal stress protein [Candidatus Angelobacter sp.]